MKNFTRFFWTLAVILLVTVRLGYSQPWSYDFGSTTGSFSTPSGTSTTFLPTPTSGTSFVRIGTGTGSINLENSGTGIQKIGSGVRLRLEAATNTSVNKASIYNYTGGKSFYTKFSILFGNSSGSTLAASSIIIFAQGDGTTYSDGNAFSGSQCFTQLQFQIAASGAITTTARVASSPTSFGATIVQGNVYTFEIFGNNTTGTISYTYNSASQTVAANKQDIWINGTIVGNDIGKATLASDVNIDSWMIYGINSATNSQNIFLDDVTYSNSIASSYTTNTNYYSKSSGNLETNTNWTTNNDGTGTITPSNFTTGYRFFNIRNNSAPTIGEDWTVSGTDSKVILGDGTNGCTFTIPSSYSLTGTVDVSNNGTLKLQNTTLPTFGTISSGSTVEYNQGSSTTATGTTYSNLTINNTAGVTLSGNTTVTGVLTLTNGTINLNGYTLSYGSVTGSNLAGLSESAALNAPSGVNVGNLGALITSGQNLGSTTVTRGFNAFSAGPNQSIKRWYKISPSNNTGLNATFVFPYAEGDELNGIPEANLRLFKSTDDGSTWLFAGGTVDAGANTVTLSGIDGFSLWTLADNDAPLPVTLSSFVSSVSNSNIKLIWKTEKEVNNAGFYVERINNEELIINNWQNIGFVKGNGTKNTPSQYSFTDSKLNTGKYNYRLKQIDYNGNFEYHNLNNIVEVGVPDKYNISQNYPNPFNPSTKISYDLPKNSFVKLIVFDILGREIVTLVNDVQIAGKYEAVFDGSQIPSGIYFARLKAGSYEHIIKMLMIK